MSFAIVAEAAPEVDEDRIDSVLEAEFNQIILKAMDGDAQSQYIAGYRYYYGRGVDVDVPKAIAFLTRAAKQDNQAAVELLKQALLYDEKKGYASSYLGDEDRQIIDSITAAAFQKSDVHVSAEVMPCYPGGLDELVKFLSTNIQYPPIAQSRGIEGRVVL